MPAAARLGDKHVCPAFNGNVPHVGGPVLPPATPNVIIGGLPAATVGCKCFCHAPPASISSGSSTVIINNKSAARQGDSTSHGGVIIDGCNTVIIG